MTRQRVIVSPGPVGSVCPVYADFLPCNEHPCNGPATWPSPSLAQPPGHNSGSISFSFNIRSPLFASIRPHFFLRRVMWSDGSLDGAQRGEANSNQNPMNQEVGGMPLWYFPPPYVSFIYLISFFLSKLN